MQNQKGFAWAHPGMNMTQGSPYNALKENIEKVAWECGRDPKEITLIAISKGHPWNHVKAVYELGCRDFGENRIKEASEKISQAPSDIQWHFIGSLQTKKIPQVVGPFSLIHSVDSLQIAEKISKVSETKGKVTKVLIQANTSGEVSKHGLTCEGLKGQFLQFMHLPFIQIEGLMTMAPLIEDQSVIRNCFRRLKIVRDELRDIAKGQVLLPHLSMGMSHDYPIAIQEGATLLRIGTAIFGGL